MDAAGRALLRLGTLNRHFQSIRKTEGGIEPPEAPGNTGSPACLLSTPPQPAQPITVTKRLQPATETW